MRGWRGSRSIPSAGDTPVTADSNRSLDNFGISPFVHADSRHQRVQGRRRLQGLYPIKEFFRFGITDPNFNDPSSPDYNPNIAPYDLTRGGHPSSFPTRAPTLLRGYLQDTIRWKNLTANIGLRYENNYLPTTNVQFVAPHRPRVLHPATGSVFRGTYSRILYTPEFENILLSTSQAAATIAPPVVQDSRPLGGGALPVKSELQNA